MFAGTAALALLLLLWQATRPTEPGSVPEWTWISCVLLVDVAHVWSTMWRTYLDPDEPARHPTRAWLLPLVAYLASVALYSQGAAVFWRVLAYLAVFHFVRQQYGWVMLYRARMRESDTLSRRLDGATIYMCTLYPLAWWHAHLPRPYSWFIPGDFVAWQGASTALLPLLQGLWCLLLAQHAARSLLAWRLGRANPGKDMVVVTTAACWYVGIIGSGTDFGFTVTNVLTHGIPYMALLHAYTRDTARRTAGALHRLAQRPLPWLATLWAIAYVEELFWDRAVWHDRPWLFGPPWDAASMHLWIVPLLALPQLVHYLLDGLLWRRGEAWLPWKGPS